MAETTVLVIDNPQGNYLEPLRRLPESLHVTISDQLDVLQEVAPKADVIMIAADVKLLEAVFPKATRLRWLHSFSAGVESYLIPDVVRSPVVMTNARGVFKESLAEFVITSALYFAKDLRRMLRNQEARVWERYDVEEIGGKVMGIIGYGETGRACAKLARTLRNDPDRPAAAAGAFRGRPAAGPRLRRGSPSRIAGALGLCSAGCPRHAPDSQVDR